MRKRASASEIAARRAQVADLWHQGLDAQQIAARLGISKYQVEYDWGALRGACAIGWRNKSRAAMHRVTRVGGRPTNGLTSKAEKDRKRQHYLATIAAMEADKGRAKRVVTMAERGGEMRITKFFASPEDAEGEALFTITARPRAVVTGDVIFVHAGDVAQQKRWVVKKVLTGAAA
jgi:hypothetical protein